MSKGKRGPSPSLRAQWLGQYLRDLRQQNDLTLERAAQYLQRDSSMLARYERAEYPIRRGDVLALMTLYGVADQALRHALIQLAEDIWRKGWWEPYAEDMGRELIDHPWLESRASHIYTYAPMIIPGLLQTRSYAETMIRNASGVGASEHQVGRWINLRMERQRVLDGRDPTRLSVIVEEWVLRRPIGSIEVVCDQLDSMLEASSRLAVELRVMSSDCGEHAGHLGRFELFDMPDPYPTVACVETLAGSLYVEAPQVQRFSQAYDELLEAALDPEESIRTISAIAEEYRNGTHDHRFTAKGRGVAQKLS